jgi:hypothetical protein
MSSLFSAFFFLCLVFVLPSFFLFTFSPMPKRNVTKAMAGVYADKQTADFLKKKNKILTLPTFSLSVSEWTNCPEHHPLERGAWRIC